MRGLQLSIVLAFALPVLLVGCSSGAKEIARYDASKDRMVYQTGTVTVAQRATNSFASSTSITMRATASCIGKGCAPQRASLVFSVEGTSDLTLSNRTLTINSDAKEWKLENRSSGYRRNSQIGRTKGRLAMITMPVSDLAEIAGASSLTGSLGDASLDLGSAQSELQDLVAAIRGGQDEGSDSSD